MIETFRQRPCLPTSTVLKDSMQMMKSLRTSSIPARQHLQTSVNSRLNSAYLAHHVWRQALAFCIVFACMAGSALAQFSGSIQGVVTDSSGAVMPTAQITLLNVDQNVSHVATSDGSGVYRFPSLAPGNYRLTAIAKGFSKGETAVVLNTNETRDVSLTLGAEGVTQGVTVTAEAPLLNTAETRNQLTLGTQAFVIFRSRGAILLRLSPWHPG